MQEALPTAKAMLSLVDGQANPFKEQVLLRVHSTAGRVGTDVFRQGPNVEIDVPFNDGIGDDYAVVVSARGYKDAGCFFRANPKVWAEPQVLMLHSDPKAEFTSWQQFKSDQPGSAALLAVGSSDAEAQGRYDDLAKNAPDKLACLLNLTKAMLELDLGDGITPVSFFKAIRWDYGMAQDRFFAYVDPALIPVVRAAAANGLFAEEKDCAEFHKGSTCSWKQVAFPVANVQLTFHEHDTAVIGGLECVMIEPDIDLYRDLVAHGFDEVIPNLLTGGLTDPFAVFAMRWTTAHDADGPAFDPGYEVG